MTNFADFFAANANAQSLTIAFGREVTARRMRAKTDDSRAKWARAQKLAVQSLDRIELANELAQEVRDGVEGVLSYHGTSAAAIVANPWLGEKLASAVGILADVERKLSSFGTVVAKIAA